MDCFRSSSKKTTYSSSGGNNVGGSGGASHSKRMEVCKPSEHGASSSFGGIGGGDVPVGGQGSRLASTASKPKGAVASRVTLQQATGTSESDAIQGHAPWQIVDNELSRYDKEFTSIHENFIITPSGAGDLDKLVANDYSSKVAVMITYALGQITYLDDANIHDMVLLRLTLSIGLVLSKLGEMTVDRNLPSALDLKKNLQNIIECISLRAKCLSNDLTKKIPLKQRITFMIELLSMICADKNTSSG